MIGAVRPLLLLTVLAFLVRAAFLLLRSGLPLRRGRAELDRARDAGARAAVAAAKRPRLLPAALSRTSSRSRGAPRGRSRPCSGCRPPSARCWCPPWPASELLAFGRRAGPRRGGVRGLLPRPRLVLHPLLVRDALHRAAVVGDRAHARGRPLRVEAHGRRRGPAVGARHPDARAGPLPRAARRTLDAAPARRDAGREWHTRLRPARARLARPPRSCSSSLLAIVPWTIRNAIVFRAFIPVSTMGGLNLWQGNTTLTHLQIYEVLARIEGPVAQDRYCRQLAWQTIARAAAHLDPREARRADARVLEGRQRGARPPGGPRGLRAARHEGARADRAAADPAVPRAPRPAGRGAGPAALRSRRPACCCSCSPRTTRPTSWPTPRLASGCP